MSGGGAKRSYVDLLTLDIKQNMVKPVVMGCPTCSSGFVLAQLVAGSLLAAAPKVIAVDIDGVIHPITVALLAHALDQAASPGRRGCVCCD
jgi:membrane-bound ClpP family serine protease